MSNGHKDRKKGTLGDTRVKLAVAIVALTITGAFFYFQYFPENLYGGGLAIDWRVKLHILDARFQSNSTPPAGIGTPGGFWHNHTFDTMNGVWVGQAGYAPLNTRDNSGTIYVQSTHCCPAYLFTLGYFFSLWGQSLSISCVGSYCASQGETIVYDSDSSGTYTSTDTVIYASGNYPTIGTRLSFDSNLKYFDSDHNGHWDRNETVVYDPDGDGVYDPKDAIAQVGVGASDIPLGSKLSLDPMIKYVESNNDSAYDVYVPPPVMSDGKTERCVSSLIGLSNGYDWVIITWSPLSQNISGKCVPP